MSILLTELVAALEGHGHLRCQTPQIEMHHDGVHIGITITGSNDSDSARLELFEVYVKLQRVADTGNLRALAMRYDIDPARLEALLPADK